MSIIRLAVVALTGTRMPSEAFWLIFAVLYVGDSVPAWTHR